MSDEKDYTIFIGNLGEKVTEKLLFELFLQAGPLEDVSLKKGFGFITFTHHISVPYTLRLFEGLQLFGRNVVLKPRDGSIYANSIKDGRRSKPMNDMGDQGSSFRDNRTPQNSPMNANNLKRIPSLTEVDVSQAGSRGAGFQQPWISPYNDSTGGQSGNHRGRQQEYPHGRYSGNFKQDGGTPGQGNNFPVGDFRDHARRKLDGKHSGRNQESFNDRPQGGSFSNRNFKDNSFNRNNTNDFDSRFQASSTPNVRRDNAAERNIYFDRKNSSMPGGFAMSSQESWHRDGGNRSFGAVNNPGGQKFDKNFRRSNNYNPQRKDGPYRSDHGSYRAHYDKPYGRQHNPKYSMDGHSRNDHSFGGGNRRQ